MNTNERILNRARKIGCEDVAKRLLDEGQSEQSITDILLTKAGRHGHIALKNISDDMLVRGLTNPAVVNLD